MGKNKMVKFVKNHDAKKGALKVCNCAKDAVVGLNVCISFVVLSLSSESTDTNIVASGGSDI